jgi:hypothetical protein
MWERGTEESGGRGREGERERGREGERERGREGERKGKMKVEHSLINPVSKLLP